MNLSEKTDPTPPCEGKLFEDGTLIFERLLPGPLTRVWSYVADSDKRARWIMAGDMSCTGRQTMTFNHTALSGEIAPERFAMMREPVHFDVEVLEVSPPHRLVFTWPAHDDAPPEKTGIVTIELKAIGDRVLLRLSHRHPDAVRHLMLNHTGGWHTHLDTLESVLSGLRPRPFWSHFAHVEAAYQRALGKRDHNAIAVNVEKAFAAPAARVFAAWLDPALIQRFLMGPQVREEQVLNIDLDPVPGGAFSFKVARAGALIDHVGHYYEIEAPYLMSFSWGIAGESDPRDSRVTLRLTDTPHGCHLSLTHTMSVEWADYAGRTRDGWAFMLEKLVAVVT
ncbi:SRPBCC domain-containing protein [Asticcacaulis excentricus]|uniref:Activator of Hsp90 ATPase 1 family protein n=1 Tax=Asticcacaulis excentricus (strain ATCC 15261 / DSM 4724 / KCTC 12464 / NCIMB 9791 / VKM B-1370 / CB 48) TaxID=573065 RepID=E8RRP8_ASTEC|nr:SRPBCC domain-containing protein [Asticcacaulis excentricus]ADU12369.1 Activator of Hsp90 ATPase 1 family protein [Asticcacaulis excentricus CB 48]